MHFTIEDYNKIEQWLKRNSVKDTEFPKVYSADGEDLVTILQGGYNKNISVNNLIESIETVYSSPIIHGDDNSSAVLNKSNNCAITKGSVALGTNNIAGAKGWYYKAVQYNTSTDVIYLYVSSKQTKPSIVEKEIQVPDKEKDIECDLYEGEDCIVVINNKLVRTSFRTNEIKKYGRISLHYVHEEHTPITEVSNLINTYDFSICSISNPHKGNITLSSNSFTTGSENIALADNAFAVGEHSCALGISSFAEGESNDSLGIASHSEGGYNNAKGNYTHVEGYQNTAQGEASHAEGSTSTATGNYSHVEGYLVEANGECSHAEGFDTVANNEAEHAEGKCNVSNANTIHSVGIGTASNDRKNAHEITIDGKHFIYGIGNYDGTNPDSSEDLVTIINKKANIDDINIPVNPSSREVEFTNPVGPHCPDPCFWKGDDGYFYVKGTGRIAKVLRTRDFVNYENTGRTFLSESALEWINDNYAHYYNSTNNIIVPHCWAPFVIKIGNNWVLYMAVVERNEVEAGIIEDGAAHIVAFTSRIPYGDFTNPVTIVSDGDFKLTDSVWWNNVIDPFVYCDPKDQKLYLVAGSSYSIGRLELTDDGLATALEKRVGNKCVRMAGLTISSDSTREYVYEGAYIYARPHNGETYYYLFASKGHYAEDNYGLIVGRSRVLTNNPGDTEKWRDREGISMINKNSNVNSRVILRGHSKNSGEPWGPGHCAGIFETVDGKTWMLYHCHTGIGENDRQLFIQEVLWDDAGWPYFEGGNPVNSDTIIPEIITKTTEVTLPSTQGIDPIIWKYICSPLVINAGDVCPAELLDSEGKFKYKVAAMYSLHHYFAEEGISINVPTVEVSDSVIKSAIFHSGVWLEITIDDQGRFQPYLLT